MVFTLKPRRVITENLKTPAAEGFGGDDFENGDYTTDPTWTYVNGGATTVGVSAIAPRTGTYGVLFVPDGDLDLATDSLRTPCVETALDVYAFIRTDIAADTTAYYMIVDATTTFIALVGMNGGNLIYLDNGGFHDFAAALANDTWYRLRIKWVKATNKVSYYVYAEDGETLIESALDKTTINPDVSSGFIEVAVTDTAVTQPSVCWDCVWYENE